MINSSRPSASVFPPPHLIITRNAHGAEEAEGLGTRLPCMAYKAYKLGNIEMKYRRKRKRVYHLRRRNIEISEKKKHVEDLGHDVRHGYK